MRILVTAGPTREHIDDIRYLSNPSSGKMGYSVATACVRAGHEVTLVSGPVALADPPGTEVVRVISAAEMAEACLSRFADCHGVVMTAAVCDYTPATRHAGKRKKTGKSWEIELVPTTDILLEMGKMKTKQVLVGFALEVGNNRENAVAKISAKNLDYIVLNSPGTFAEDIISCEIIDRQGRGTRYDSVTKQALALEIVNLLEPSNSGTT